jgi:DNA topoisomerase-2
MDYTEAASLNSLRYGRLVILSDQDVDGMHIRGLIHNFFRLKFPSLLSIGYVQVMETPLLRVKYGGKVIPFYYQREYDEWVKEKVDEEQKRRKCKVDYFKGLGSSNDEQLLDAFRVARYITLSWDEKADNLMAVAFDEGFEDDRKEWLMTWDPIKREGMYAG